MQPNAKTPGRPPKNPEDKVSTPARALFTSQMASKLQAAAAIHDIPAPAHGKVPSDILRLYVFWGLKKDGLITEDIEADPSWDTLKEKGLV